MSELQNCQHTTSGNQAIPCSVCYRTAVVWSGQSEMKRISTTRERAVVRDVLAKEQRPRRTMGSVEGSRHIPRIWNETCLVDRFPLVTNIGCENSGQCKKRLQPSWNACLIGRVLICPPNPPPAASNCPDGSLEKCRLFARASMMKL